MEGERSAKSSGACVGGRLNGVSVAFVSARSVRKALTYASEGVGALGF